MIHSWLTLYPGVVLKFGFVRDVCRHWIWKLTHINTSVPRKSNPFIYQSAQFWAKFWTKLAIFSKILLNLSQLWLKFGQILQNRPIHIPHFAFDKGYSCTKRLILLPMLAAHPCRVFCTKYPPGLYMCISRLHVLQGLLNDQFKL